MQLLFFLAFSQNYQRSAPIRHQPLTLDLKKLKKLQPNKEFDTSAAQLVNSYLHQIQTKYLVFCLFREMAKNL